MTEDSIRKYLKELKVPKELMGFFLESVSKKKEDLYSVIGSEVAKVLTKVDLAKEFGKFLETHRVKVVSIAGCGLGLGVTEHRTDMRQAVTLADQDAGI